MRYLIDAGASKVTLQVFPTGMLSSLGHSPTFAVRKVAGEIEFDGGASPKGAVKLSFETGSIELQGDFNGRDRWDIMHIMQDEILEIEKHPTIVYDAPAGRTTITSAGNERFQAGLKGDLTLHGVTRPHPTVAHLLAHGDMLRASGEVTVRQPDYQLKSVAVAGSMMKVKDDVKLTFDIVARK